jgi:type VI secretion system secreted protein VgrG
MTSKKRALTEGEISLAKTIFGDSIDYAKVGVHNHKISRLQPDNFNAAPDGNLYMIKNYSDDFSKSPAEDQAALMHELTHVWQIQNNTMNLKAAFVKETLKAKFNYRATNRYTLEQGKDLNRYGFEQQAGIVEDFVRLSNGKAPLYNQSKNHNLDDYKAALKNIIANPAYARREKKRFLGMK